MLVVPNVDATPVYRQLGAAGRKALQAWVKNGGRYVGWQEGTVLASALKLSSVGLSSSKTKSPGALMRIETPHGQNEVMWDDDYGLQMTPGNARVVAAFPAHMFVSGYAKNAATLAGTAVEAVDDVHAGSVTVFNTEPNFRAFTDGSARLLFDAILGTPSGSVPATAATAAQTVYSGPGALVLGHTPAQRLAYDNGGMP